MGIILIGRAAGGILGIEALQFRLPWVGRLGRAARAHDGAARSGAPVMPKGARAAGDGTRRGRWPPSPSREVAVRFGGVSALSDVSLTVQPGTVTGLIGPNGAGKTTLFNVISGLQVPDRGTVHLFDTDVTTMKPHRRARLGLARTFQRLEIFGTLTAGENVQVGLESTVKWWEWRRSAPGVPVEAAWQAEQGAGRRRTGRRPSRLLATTTCDRLLDGVGLEGWAASSPPPCPPDWPGWWSWPGPWPSGRSSSC